MERQRLPEVTMDAGGRLRDRVLIGRAGFRDPACEREERADALVALKQEVNGVGRRRGLSEPGEHT
jgi:hypothetical protein